MEYIEPSSQITRDTDNEWTIVPFDISIKIKSMKKLLPYLFCILF
jgi:hypothetical protein